MIEIHLCESTEPPSVMRNSGKNTIVKVSQGMELNQILSKLTLELTPQEYQLFINLWSNDSYPRVFNKQGEYLVIKDKP